MSSIRVSPPTPSPLSRQFLSLSSQLLPRLPLLSLRQALLFPRPQLLAHPRLLLRRLLLLLLLPQHLPRLLLLPQLLHLLHHLLLLCPPILMPSHPPSNLLLAGPRLRTLLSLSLLLALLLLLLPPLLRHRHPQPPLRLRPRPRLCPSPLSRPPIALLLKSLPPLAAGIAAGRRRLVPIFSTPPRSK